MDNLVITADDGVAAELLGSVTEITDGTAGENTTNLTDTGVLAFTDVDLTDVHTVSTSANGTGYLGTMVAVVSNDTTGEGTGEVTWTFEVADSAVDYLAAGESLTQTYDIVVNDNEGAPETDTQNVTVTVTGVNDSFAPVTSAGLIFSGGGSPLLVQTVVDTNNNGVPDQLGLSTVISTLAQIRGIDYDDLDGDMDFFLSGWDSADVIYVNDGYTNNDGELEFTTQVVNPDGDNLESELFDIDGDGDIDIIMPDYSTCGVEILFNDGAQNFTSLSLDGAGRSYGLAVGDIDEDGDADIVAANNVGESTVFVNNGDTDNDGVIDFTSEALAGTPGSWDVAFINSDEFAFG